MKPSRHLRGVLWCSRLVLFVAVFLLLPRSLNASAIDPDSPFLQQVWQTDHGLPHNIVNAIIQTRDGYLWIGTRRGVARFDGMRFTVLDIPEIRIQNITALCEDKQGRLWIASEGGVFQYKDGTVTHYGQEEGLADDNVRSLCQTQDGSMWFGTAHGLTQFKNGAMRSFTQADGLARNIIRSLAEDHRGVLWIATDGGLCQYKDGVISVPESAKTVGTGARFVCLDAEQNLWVGTHSGLFRQNKDGWDRFSTRDTSLPDNFISTIYPDRIGRIWIGSYGGLNRLVNGKLYTDLTAEGTAYDLVSSVCEDREGNIWIGSKDGLTRLKTKLFTPVTKSQGLTYNNVMSVLQDKTGAVWSGTWGGGLFRIETRDDKAFHITNTFPDSRILSLCEGADGSIWFGTDHGGGLFRLKDGNVHHFGEQHGLENTGIPVIQKDSAGKIWLGTARSLAQFHDGKFVHFTRKDGLAGDYIRVIFEDKSGDLWIGSNTGLSRRQHGRYTNYTTTNGLSHAMVLALHEDSDGTLWIGTGAGGLNRFRDGKFTSYSVRDGLFSPEVLEILEDDAGYLWMSCLKGIFRVSKQDLDRYDRKEIATVPCTSFGKDDGMLSVICSNVAKPAAWKDRQGRLWFATSKGLAVADPSKGIRNTPPPVIIEEVVANKTVIGGLLVPLGQRSLNIPPGRGELEIKYTALNFQSPEKIRFNYKLVGVDSEWVTADTRRVAYYNNLAPGNYTFQVIASNNDNLWTDAAAQLQFTLSPHYWQTLWFKFSLTVFGLCLAGSGARLLTQKRMQAKLQRLEQQSALEKERTRIAQDMHDDLGVRLSEILLLSNMADKEVRPDEHKNLNRKISHTARELVDNLDAIVWAVNPKNDSLETFVHYLFEFAPAYLKMSNIRCLFDSPLDLPDYPLASEVRHNLFLVVKESLYNIVKHAAATEVQIHLALESGQLKLDIRDNGQGFAPKADSAFGNGLLNMKDRLTRIGGQFEISSAPGKGTCIHLRIPVKNIASTR